MCEEVRGGGGIIAGRDRDIYLSPTSHNYRSSDSMFVSSSLDSSYAKFVYIMFAIKVKSTQAYGCPILKEISAILSNSKLKRSTLAI